MSRTNLKYLIMYYFFCVKQMAEWLKRLTLESFCFFAVGSSHHVGKNIIF